MLVDASTATRKELLALPERPWNVVRTYESILLFPTNRKHDSGFALMLVIGCYDRKASEIAVSTSDDIKWHISEMERCGDYHLANLRTDCFVKNGGLHFWMENNAFTIGHAVSSVNIYVHNKGDLPHYC